MKYRIYLAHSRDKQFDFQHDYYEPIQSAFSEHEIHVPHSPNAIYVDSETLLPQCSLMIAEVSYPSTGLGMELIWAKHANIPVLCIHKTATPPSSSVTNKFSNVASYENTENMVIKIKDWMNEHRNELRNVNSSPALFK